jgi:hypothetical protein
MGLCSVVLAHALGQVADPITTNEKDMTGPRSFAGLTRDDTVMQEDAAWFLELDPQELRRLRRRTCGPPFIRLGRHAISYRAGDLADWHEHRCVQKV